MRRPAQMTHTPVSAIGILLSFQLDLPTGATIVCTFGAALALMAIYRVLSGRELIRV